MATLGEFGTSDEMLSHICSQLAGEFMNTDGTDVVRVTDSPEFDLPFSWRDRTS
jgi:hypothetical protein